MPSMPISGSQGLHAALTALGQLLDARHLPTELVVIGGGGLILGGFTDRTTRDVDVVARFQEHSLRPADEIPAAFFAAVRDVARDLGLEPNWLNTGPKDLLRAGLPEGFLARCSRHDYHALTLFVAGRLDQIHLKLYAAVDDGPRGRHFQDLRMLAPTSDELSQAGIWCRAQDPSPAFRGFLLQAMRAAGWEGSDEQI